MSTMGLDPVESADFAEQARSGGLGLPPSDPWLTRHTIAAPVFGIATGAANLAFSAEELATPMLRPIAEEIDKAFGTSGVEWLDREQRIARAQIVKQQQIPTQVFGYVGDTLRGGAQAITEAAAGFAVAGPLGAAATLGGAEALPEYRKMIADRVDPETAKTAAIVTGATSAALAFVPFGGKTVLTSIGRGAVLMPYMNAWQRGLTGEVLDNAGYHDMAEQYKVFDGRAIATDIVMGALFGGGGHVLHGTPPAEFLPRQADAALVDTVARNREEHAPGIPADPYTRSANVDALDKALHDELIGDPVDVSAQIDAERATFVRDPYADDNENIWRAAVEEQYGPAIAEAQRIQAEAEAAAAAQSPIKAAVVRFGGEEFDARTHIEAFKQAEAAGAVPRDREGRISLGPNDSYNLFRLRDGTLVTRDEAERIGGAKRTEELPPMTGATLDSLASEIGWAERGGLILRDEARPGGIGGDVIGRSKWVPYSDFWPGRPDKSLTQKGAGVALDKVKTGERLTPKEKRFIDYARETLRRRGAEEELMRIEELEKQRAAKEAETPAEREARLEREALQDESAVTHADMVEGGYFHLTEDERIAFDRQLEYIADREAQHNEIERINQEFRAELERGYGAHDAGIPRPGAAGITQDRGGAQGPALGQGEGQDPLALARQLAAERPELHVVTAEGDALPINEYIARAEAEGASADEVARLAQVAVDCAIRGLT